MEAIQPKAKATTKKKLSKSSSIRVSNEVRKLLVQILAKANKKAYGKRIKPDAILSVALGFIGDSVIKKLQENSYTYADQLDMKYREFIKRNGHISKDEFLGKVMEEGLNFSAANSSSFPSEKPKI